jgi:hypothetical protein
MTAHGVKRPTGVGRTELGNGSSTCFLRLESHTPAKFSADTTAFGDNAKRTETARRDAEQANAQAAEFAGLFARLNAELEKANAQRASETEASGNLKACDGGQQSFRPNELSLPAAYVVRDAAGNCAVVDFQPSAPQDNRE